MHQNCKKNNKRRDVYPIEEVLLTFPLESEEKRWKMESTFSAVVSRLLARTLRQEEIKNRLFGLL